MVWIKVRYPAKCNVCSDVIKYDKEALWEPGSRNIWHPACLKHKSGTLDYDQDSHTFIVYPGPTGMYLRGKVRSMPMGEWKTTAQHGTLYAMQGLGTMLLEFITDYGLDCTDAASAAAHQLYRADQADPMSEAKLNTYVQPEYDDEVKPEPTGDPLLDSIVKHGEEYMREQRARIREQRRKTRKTARARRRVEVWDSEFRTEPVSTEPKSYQGYDFKQIPF